MKEPFFYGMDNEDMLVQQAKVLGSKELNEYIVKYRMPVKPELREQC